MTQAIPKYAMSMFKLPRKICKDIVSLMSNFWWSHMNKSPRVHWKTWQLLGETKAQSGLGFRDLEAFNKSFLAKQIWRLFESPLSFAAQILKFKYFSFSRVLDAKLSRHPSLL